ncbi:hypothetical protein GCM10027290_26730 [Micromonospora sonneratiae]|uniref:Alkaline shock response membrane anchor protein AmaP n=1 Tax=Micromonospora sonneratiae TaxID=1184706 RepID=A0ABW3YC19_9ACTN
MRLANRLASLLLAVVLLAGGLLIVVETGLAAFGLPALLIDRDGWYAALSTTRLDDPVTRTVAGTVTLLGVLILLAELRRWTPERLGVQLANCHLHRRSMERRLAGAAGAVAGVASATARIRRRGRVWRPRIRVVADPSVRPAVERAVRRELDRLAVPPAQPLGVRVVRNRRAR